MLIRLKNDRIFTRDDFVGLGGYDQVGRALRRLVESNNIIKIGYWLYTKTKVSSITGTATIQLPLVELAKEALEKLGVKFYLSRSLNLYNEGKSTLAFLVSKFFLFLLKRFLYILTFLSHIATLSIICRARSLN